MNPRKTSIVTLLTSNLKKYINILAAKGLELEALKKEHEEKSSKIQELKRQIEATKHLLENKKEVPEEQMEALKNLSKKYNSMRDEYYALLAEKSSKKEK